MNHPAAVVKDMPCRITPARMAHPDAFLVLDAFGNRIAYPDHHERITFHLAGLVHRDSL